MRKILITIIISIIMSGFLLAQDKQSDVGKNWPHWRGPLANGVSPNGNPPSEWNEEKNVKWKVEIPGTGYETPVIWGDQIIILTAIEVEGVEKPKEQAEQPQQGRRWGMPSKGTENVHKFVVLSVNRQNGEIQWQKTVKEEVPQERTHNYGSWASNSPVTDGKHIYAYFGSRGIFCLDMKGNLKWQRDFGQMEKRMSFGEGSSPVLYEDKIIILWDHEGESFIVALDKNSGKDVWKTDRDEGTSWATPFVVEVNGKPQVITSATKLIRSYDIATGELIWQCSGMTNNVIPMPVTDGKILYLMSGFRGNALLAVDLSKAKGDITGSDAIIWEFNKDTPYTPSPILLDNMLYFLKSNNGSLSCLDKNDGKVYYSKQKLDETGSIFTSPVATRDRIFVLGGTGLTYVIKHGAEFEILSKNKLDDKFHASPAIIGNNIYLRGFKYLYCISEE